MQHTLKPLLTVYDIMVIFVVSRVTVYRWNRLAKEGKSSFPVAVSNGKQGLRWSQESVLDYLNSQSPQPIPKVEGI